MPLAVLDGLPADAEVLVRLGLEDRFEHHLPVDPDHATAELVLGVDSVAVDEPGYLEPSLKTTVRVNAITAILATGAEETDERDDILGVGLVARI